MSKANKALAMVNKLAVSREKKYELQTFADASITSNGAVFYINRVTLGDEDAGERNGDVINCVRVELNLQFTIPPALSGSHALRVIIINDKQNSLANAGELLLGVGTTVAPMLLYSKDYRLRSQVIYDSNVQILHSYQPTRSIRATRNINVETRFLLATDTITTGALKAIFISDMPTAAPNFPTVTGMIRVQYTDS
jgi:hypothetical protein